MKMPVTSLYRAPDYTLINYDFVISHKLPNTNIIIIYAVKKTDAPAGPSKGFIMRHNMFFNPAFAQHKIIKNGKGYSEELQLDQLKVKLLIVS